MQNNPKIPVIHNKSGFTLIELSIVLVIIGLLVGGVLAGQELMHSALVRKQVNQLQNYQTAFSTFQLKYNCIPGDCAKATQYFGTTDPYGNAINNGDGNGFIDTNTRQNYNSGGTLYGNSVEMWGAYQQLSIAKMIDYVPTNPSVGTIGVGIPPLKINTGTGFVFGASYNFANSSGRNPDISAYQRGTNWLWLAMCNIPSGTWDSNCAIFTAYEALSIDQKIDDGTPLSGVFFGFGGVGGMPNDCLNGTAYKLTNTTAQCQAAFMLN